MRAVKVEYEMGLGGQRQEREEGRYVPGEKREGGRGKERWKG